MAIFSNYVASLVDYISQKPSNERQHIVLFIYKDVKKVCAPVIERMLLEILR